MATKKKKTKTKATAPYIPCPDCKRDVGVSDYCPDLACRRSVWPIWIPEADLNGTSGTSELRDKHNLVFTGLRWARQAPGYVKPVKATPLKTEISPEWAEDADCDDNGWDDGWDDNGWDDSWDNLPVYEQEEELNHAVRQDELRALEDDLAARINDVDDQISGSVFPRVEELEDAVQRGTKAIAELQNTVRALTKQVFELRNPVPAFGWPDSPPLRATHAQGRVTSNFRLPRNHGKTWHYEEDALLEKMYVSGKKLEFICLTLGRTPFAIFMRLVKRNLVNENNVFTLWEQGVDTYSRALYV